MQAFLQLILDISEKVNQQSQAYFQGLKRLKQGSGSESPRSVELHNEIKKNQDQCKYLSDEKIVIIEETDKVIDSYLIQLDKHINRFQNDLRDMEVDQKPIHEESLPETIISTIPKKRKIIHKGDRDTNINKKPKKMDEIPYKQPMKPSPFELPGDEPQAIYCLCQKQTDEVMVECDNPRCKYKWFHFSCVGLTSAPSEDEKWYCPDCKTKLQNKHK